MGKVILVGKIESPDVKKILDRLDRAIAEINNAYGELAEMKITLEEPTSGN